MLKYQFKKMNSVGMDSVGAQQMGESLTTKASDNMYGNPWVEFFGPPNGEIRTNAYDKYSYDRFNLPNAYQGQNLFLRNTIDGFIMEGHQWYTTVCLPYARTDQLTVAWNEWKFDQHLVGRVPHEGVSRLIRSSFARALLWLRICIQLLFELR